MTIFLKVLKKLIKEQLSPLSTKLNSQTKTIGYNKQLSLDQKEVIDELDNQIVMFAGTGNDEADAKGLVRLIEVYRAKIQSARESNGAPRDEGNTLSCVSHLIFHTSGFYTKLAEFKFSLLNRPYTQTPEGIVYFHAAYYFGEEIFSPLSNSDVSIRAKKEERLQIRLQSLSEIIKPTYTLEEQRTRTMQVLHDLASDNKMVIKKDDEASSVALPGLSFWGFQITAPLDWFAPGLGRFGEQFNLAVRKIKAMTPESFNPRETQGDRALEVPSERPEERQLVRVMDEVWNESEDEVIPDQMVNEGADEVTSNSI